MPLVRIDLRRGKSAEYKKAICDGVYQALREIFKVPENDRFMVVTDRDDADFIHSQTYLGIEHKKQLYARIVALLAEDPGIKPQDVFINLVEVDISDWSFGNGIAQYVER